MSHTIDKFIIEDSVFISPNVWFKDFCEFMKKEKVQWIMYARINEIINFKKSLSLLKKSGCKSVIIGIETPRENLLKKTNKLIKLNQIREAIYLLKKEKIIIQGTFLLAFYEDTLNQIKSDIKFSKKLNLDIYRWHILQESFDKINKRDKKKYNYFDYLKMEMDLPDNLLPKMLKIFTDLICFDEHFLIRCIPHLKDLSILKKVKYKNFNFEDFFKILKEELGKTSKVFNEECMNHLVFQ